MTTTTTASRTRVACPEHADAALRQDSRGRIDCTTGGLDCLTWSDLAPAVECRVEVDPADSVLYVGEPNGVQVAPCRVVACYQQRNGRQCFTARHTDGRTTYGWESYDEAVVAAHAPSYAAGEHQINAC